MSQKPIAGQGLECDPARADCGFPNNWPLEFEFDRWLRPDTASRASIQVGRVGRDEGTFFAPVYNPLTRKIHYKPNGNWFEGYVCDLRLYDPNVPADKSWGFRAYDNQLLDRSGISEHVLFRVGAPADVPMATVPKVSCRDALQAFAVSGCTASNCHRVDGECIGEHCQKWPRAGLALDSAAGLRSAIGRVARATDRGPRAGEPDIMPERFGMNMPIVESGEPALSLMIYRLLLGRDAYRDREGKFVVDPPSAAELERARSWFGVIGEMPPPEVGWPRDSSPIDLVNTLLNWVWGGADTTVCD